MCRGRDANISARLREGGLAIRPVRRGHFSALVLAAGLGDSFEIQLACRFADSPNLPGVDPYCLVRAGPATHYGSAESYEVDGSVMRLWLTPDAADVLGVPPAFEVDPGTDGAPLARLNLPGLPARGARGVRRSRNDERPAIAGRSWCWRWRRDLNPRRVAPHALSRRALSAAQTRHRGKPYSCPRRRRQSGDTQALIGPPPWKRAAGRAAPTPRRLNSYRSGAKRRTKPPDPAPAGTGTAYTARWASKKARSRTADSSAPTPLTTSTR